MYTTEELDRLQLQVKICIEMALQCVEPEQLNRPTMLEVVSRLDDMFQNRSSPPLFSTSSTIDPASRRSQV